MPSFGPDGIFRYCSGWATAGVTAAWARPSCRLGFVPVAKSMPRKTDGDLAVRDVAMAAATLGATLVPLEVLEHSVEALDLALITARDGNPNSATDAGVGAACALAAAEGASLNVRINLSGLEIDTTAIVERHDTALTRARTLGSQVAATVEVHLGSE